ncbi:MAG: fatty acid hydroxylase family protein, partial [Candidatus Binatia bacterium]
VYHRHVVEHHAFFTYDDMAVDSWRDIRWVLFPPWALPLMLATVAPIFALIWAVAPPNYPWLFLLAVVTYYGIYEFFHALAHLPADNPLAGNRLVRAVTHHHRVHHDPALMKRWNFNFAIPIFDWLFGTLYRGELRAAAGSSSRTATG